MALFPPSTTASPAAPAPAPAPSQTIFQPDIFNDRVLLCTGGGSGICKEITAAIMRHGANAVIIGRRLENLEASARELAAATGKICLAAQADVRQPQQLKAAVDKAIASFGRLDYVVCGAAGNFLAPAGGMSENAFRTVIEIDALGTFNTVKATLAHVRAARGAYIHITATLSFRGTAFQAHASAAKAAIDSFSSVLAVEEGPRGVRSNVIAPGPVVETEGMERLTARAAGYGARLSRSIPLQRQGVREDIANAAVFLLSGAAAWVTGQVLVVDGGARHTMVELLPYPDGVLDPEGAQAIMQPRA